MLTKVLEGTAPSGAARTPSATRQEPSFTCDLDGNCAPTQRPRTSASSRAGLESAVSMEPVVPGNSAFDTSLGNRLGLPEP